MTTADSGGADENLVLHLYLFFELWCTECTAKWEPDNPSEAVGDVPELWAEQFSRKFGPIAQNLGWGSVNGEILCPRCYGSRGLTTQ